MGNVNKPHKIQAIEVPLCSDERGSLLALEKSPDILPFKPVRIFYLLDVPPGKKRACHAVSCDLFILALSGGAKLINIHRQSATSEWALNNRTTGLYIPAYHYIELSGFSEDTVLAVCASRSLKNTRHYSLLEMQEKWQKK
jgi:hypothetical protein